ncbi:MAG TPA: Yip1 family protein [Ktedonobacterales bacterium]|nr:Yip1 family protein [Ktedonobacterales bacterium]
MSTDPTQQSGSGQPPYYEYGPTGNTGDPYANQYSQPYGGSPQDPYSPPPPPNYAYTSYGGGPQAAPLPLSQALGQLPNQYWKAVSKPGAATFAEEAGKAEWGIILVQLFGYAIITAILGTISSGNSMASLRNALNTSSSTTTTTPAATLSPAAFLILSLVVTLVFFFIGQGIYFGLAKAFGGQGTFTAQAYSALLYQVPLGILSSLLAFIPLLGTLVALAAGIYQIVLSVFMIMGVHRLSGGKASAVILIPVGVALLLVCILFIVAFAFIAAALRATQ